MNIQPNKINLILSAGREDQLIADGLPQIAFSGRSNVGKSSLINLLTGRNGLARVSQSPGKTVTVNYYNADNAFYFVDLPGYGFAKRRDGDRDAFFALTDSYFTKRADTDNPKLVLQLIDSRVGPTADDVMMIKYLRKSKIPFVLVATKTDKLNAAEKAGLEAKIRSVGGIGERTPIYPVSALKKTGRDELLALIETKLGE